MDAGPYRSKKEKVPRITGCPAASLILRIPGNREI